MAPPCSGPRPRNPALAVRTSGLVRASKALSAACHPTEWSQNLFVLVQSEVALLISLAVAASDGPPSPSTSHASGISGVDESEYVKSASSGSGIGMPTTSANRSAHALETPRGPPPAGRSARLHPDIRFGMAASSGYRPDQAVLHQAAVHREKGRLVPPSQSCRKCYRQLAQPVARSS